MAEIEEILGVSPIRTNAIGGEFRITYAIVDGDEVSGYSLVDDPYEVGESVEKYFSIKYNNAEMRKKRLQS